MAVALSTMTMKNIQQNKTNRKCYGIFKIEKMTKIRPGMAEMQAKTCSFIARKSCFAYVLYMTAEMDRQKCLRNVFCCIFAMPGPILFIFSFF